MHSYGMSFPEKMAVFLLGLIVISVRLFIIYALAAMCSSHVYMDIDLTEWGSIWTWFWILLWAWLTSR